MGHFARQLNAQEIKQGYDLLNLMEHLDREMDLLNQQRIDIKELQFSSTSPLQSESQLDMPSEHPGHP